MTLESIAWGRSYSDKVTITFKKGNTWCTVCRGEIRQFSNLISHTHCYKNERKVLKGEETELKLDICELMKMLDYFKTKNPNVDFYAMSVYYDLRKSKVKKIVPEGNYNLYVELE